MLFTLHIHKNPYSSREIVHAVEFMQARKWAMWHLIKLRINISACLQTVSKSNWRVHSCTIHNRKAELRPNASWTPALFLNVSNKNDSSPVIYIDALFKSPCWSDEAACWSWHFQPHKDSSSARARGGRRGRRCCVHIECSISIQGTLVLGLLLAGRGVYCKCMCAHSLCFVVPFSFSALSSCCPPTGGWGAVKWAETLETSGSQLFRVASSQREQMWCVQSVSSPQLFATRSFLLFYPIHVDKSGRGFSHSKITTVHHCEQIN